MVLSGPSINVDPAGLVNLFSHSKMFDIAENRGIISGRSCLSSTRRIKYCQLTIRHKMSEERRPVNMEK